MVKSFFLKSGLFIYAAFIISLLIYSGLFTPSKKREDIFKCLLPINKISEISGTVCSSPVKLKKSKCYSVNFHVKSVTGKNNEKSSAQGKITLFLPEEDVEALFPGKLFSAAKKNKGFIYDEGADICVRGKFFSKKENSSSDIIFKGNEILKSSWNNDFLGKIKYFRAIFRLKLKRLLFSWKDSGALLLALITGMREYTDEKLSSLFRKAGLSHILALSGMHLMLFRKITSFFNLRFFGKRNISLLIEIFVISVFVFFAGLSPSLLRAFLCSLCSIILNWLGFKNVKMTEILSFSFLIHLIILPEHYQNAGFILSYSALFGILLLSDFINSKTVKILPETISSSFSASFSAQIFTMPVSLLLFKSFAPVGIISSVIVSPIITFFIYSGIFLIILCLIFPFFSDFSAFFMKILYNLIEFLVLLFSKFKIISIN